MLSVGAGLLVDRAAGAALPGILIPPVGLAGLVMVAELFTWTGATSQLTPVALVIVGLAGYPVGLAAPAQFTLGPLADGATVAAST